MLVAHIHWYPPHFLCMGGEVSKSKQAEYMDTYRLKHKAEINKKRRDLHAERKGWLRAIKALKGCQDCGEADPRVLQFHHRDPADKRFAIADNVTTYKKETLLEEVTKCDVLCANCHIKRHHKES